MNDKMIQVEQMIKGLLFAAKPLHRVKSASESLNPIAVMVPQNRRIAISELAPSAVPVFENQDKIKLGEFYKVEILGYEGWSLVLRYLEGFLVIGKPFWRGRYIVNFDFLAKRVFTVIGHIEGKGPRTLAMHHISITNTNTLDILLTGFDRFRGKVQPPIGIRAAEMEAVNRGTDLWKLSETWIHHLTRIADPANPWYATNDSCELLLMFTEFGLLLDKDTMQFKINLEALISAHKAQLHVDKRKVKS